MTARSEQESRSRYRYRTTRRGGLMIDSYQPNLLYDSEKDRQLDAWWNRDVVNYFDNKLQTWMSEQGARIATNAGMNVERESHEMAENTAAESLIDVLASSNGYHFEVSKIMEKAKRHVRNLINISGLDSRATGFLLDFADIVGEARNLSETHTKQLKSSVLQRKLQI